MEEDLSAIETGTAGLLGVETRRLEALADPQYAFDPRRRQHRRSDARGGGGYVRMRFESDRHHRARPVHPDADVRVRAGAVGRRLGLVSLARLRQEFYGLPADRSVFLSRTLKETAHELGHTLGLAHCADRLCAMSLSTDIRQVDGKRAEYCGGCLSAAGLSRDRTA